MSPELDTCKRSSYTDIWEKEQAGQFPLEWELTWGKLRSTFCRSKYKNGGTLPDLWVLWNIFLFTSNVQIFLLGQAVIVLGETKGIGHGRKYKTKKGKGLHGEGRKQESPVCWMKNILKHRCCHFLPQSIWMKSRNATFLNTVYF